MTSNTMNFGPEWMRRFPAKTTSASAHSSQHDLLPRAPSPLQDWGQLAAQSAGSAITPGAAGGGNPTGPAFSYSSVAATNARSLNGPSSASLSAGSYEAPLSESIASDTLNPFKYSKDLMLSLFKPVSFPIEFERHEYATSEDALMPMSSQPFSDQEIKVRFFVVLSFRLFDWTHHFFLFFRSTVYCFAAPYTFKMTFNA